MDYDKKAKDFLTKTGITLHVQYLTTKKHFADDTEARDVYQANLVRGKKTYSFEFGDSIVNTRKNANAVQRTKPNAYAILSCLDGYEPDGLDDFASEYLIEKPSEAIHIYDAVKREHKALTDMFDDEELEALREIN